MPAVAFSQLPADARVWVFGASRPLSAVESARLQAIADDFIAGWAAHGMPVTGAAEVRDGRFLLIGADERATGVSGCSTDSMFHALGAAERELGIDLRDASQVFWRGAAGEIRAATRPEFRALAAAGEVDAATVVFDLTAATAGELLHLEKPLAESWHGRAFPIGAPR